MPIVLEELYSVGIKPNQIKIIIATGTHRPMTEKEIEAKYGRQLMNEVEIKNHNYKDQNNLIYRGTTRRGTRIIVNKEFLNADIRIGIGGVLPHHPVGWSGGAKILLPGVAGDETTSDMHLIGATEQQLGKVETPCRQEMEDFANEVGLHFIVNVIMDKEGNILKCLSGHFIKAHREAVNWGLKVFGVKFNEYADITLSSTYPMDYDLSQGDKGLFSAELATKQGGEIILLSPCAEGIAPTHEEAMVWLAQFNDETIGEMLRTNQIKDRFAAAESMYLNHIKKNFKATLMMDPISTSIMRFHYISKNDLPSYLDHRLKIDHNLKIGIVHQSTEVLPIFSK
jgi:nickel-dependent lactate racemase